MTADPHIERSVRIAKAIREDSSDPASFPLWKPWAMDMADGIGALAARLEAAERDREALRGIIFEYVGTDAENIDPEGWAALAASPASPAEAPPEYKDRPLTHDFYFDPGREEWVYKWSDQRRVLRPKGCVCQSSWPASMRCDYCAEVAAEAPQAEPASEPQVVPPILASCFQHGAHLGDECPLCRLRREAASTAEPDTREEAP